MQHASRNNSEVKHWAAKAKTEGKKVTGENQSTSDKPEKPQANHVEPGPFQNQQLRHQPNIDNLNNRLQEIAKDVPFRDFEVGKEGERVQIFQNLSKRDYYRLDRVINYTSNGIGCIQVSVHIGNDSDFIGNLKTHDDLLSIALAIQSQPVCLK
jgi:hypothetical protein